MVGFLRPPEAPVFRPTSEEFANPLTYILKIRPVAEKAGICKIIPPAGWKPPFSINPTTFRFRTRLQRLCELEGTSRVRLLFRERLATFWELQGIENFREPIVEQRTVDLFRLHKEVEKRGGFQAVCTKSLWVDITKALGYSTHAGARPSTTAYFLRKNYERFLSPYDMFIERVKNGDSDSQDTEKAIMEARRGDATPSMRSMKREPVLADVMVKEEIVPLALKTEDGAEVPRRRVRVAPVLSVPSPGQAVGNDAVELCKVCGHGHDEDSLLLCDGCDAPYHMYCLSPPLSKVPRGDWHCPECLREHVSVNEGAYGFEDSGLHSIDSFKRLAERFEAEHFRGDRRSGEELEREFWSLVSNPEKDVAVHYGADIHTSKTGSGFPTKATAMPENQSYVTHGWNLNNIPVLPESVLGYIRTDISGMMVPWLYMGMCFSSFCWHYEDHWSHSVNYLHFGQPKTWYGVPGSASDSFERAMRESVPELFEGNPDLLFQLTTLISPGALIAKGVPVCRTDQREGEFVITFPRAYHAGFNNGYNCAEAVNFATYDWMPLGMRCVETYRSLGRSPVFSHDELLCNIAVGGDDVNIAIALQAKRELKQRVAWEFDKRDALAKWGVTKAELCEIERLSDDERECVVCRMASYWSCVACSCKPKRMACLDHAKELCPCAPANKTLLLRHSVAEMDALVAKLQSRADRVVDFDKEAMQLLAVSGDGAAKPSIRALKTTLNAARRLIASLGAIVDGQEALFSLASLGPLDTAVSASEAVRQSGLSLLGRMQRTRSEKEDLPSLDEVSAWITAADAAPSDLGDLIARMTKIKDRAVAFQVRATAFLASKDMFTGDFDEVARMVDLAEALDVRVDEAQSVRECFRRWQWHEACVRATESPSTFTVSELHELVSQGRRLGYKCAVGDAVAALYDRAAAWTARVRPVLASRVDVDVLTQLLEEVEHIGVHTDEVDRLRDIVRKERDWSDRARTMLAATAPVDAIEALLVRARALPCIPMQETAAHTAVTECREWAVRADAIFFRRRAKDDGIRQVQSLVDALRLVDADAVRKRRDHHKAMALQNKYCCGEDSAGVMICCDLCHGWFHMRCVGARKDSRAARERFFCPTCGRTRRPMLDKVERLVEDSMKLKATVREIEAVRRQYEAALAFSGRARAFLATIGDAGPNTDDMTIERLNRLLTEGDSLEVLVPEVQVLVKAIAAAEGVDEDATDGKDDDDVTGDDKTTGVDGRHAASGHVTLHCLCRRPSRDFMIACDRCDEWFHGECVRITANDAETMASFVCPPCGETTRAVVEGPIGGRDCATNGGPRGKAPAEDHPRAAAAAVDGDERVMGRGSNGQPQRPTQPTPPLTPLESVSQLSSAGHAECNIAPVYQPTSTPALASPLSDDVPQSAKRPFIDGGMPASKRLCVDQATSEVEIARVPVGRGRGMRDRDYVPIRPSHAMQGSHSGASRAHFAVDMPAALHAAHVHGHQFQEAETDVYGIPLNARHAMGGPVPADLYTSASYRPEHAHAHAHAHAH
eukprot:Opistho-2@90972